MMAAARSARYPIRIKSVLFLGTGNSARSIIAEAILNRVGAGRFAAFSAGSRPSGKVSIHAEGILKHYNYPIGKFRSKSWDEYARSRSPRFDFVVTLCDEAARESCPVWRGAPVKLHWSIPDPARVIGDDTGTRAAFAATYARLYDRIAEFVRSMPQPQETESSTP